MSDAKSVARVNRILRGELRQDDLINLFLFARDRCDGRESVQEIGDFVAHHSERTKGIVTRNSRDFFAIVRYHIPKFAPGGPHPIDLEKLPSVTPQYLWATSRRIENKLLKSKCGISKSDLKKAIPSVIQKLRLNADGSHSGIDLLKDQKLLNIFKGLSSCMCVQPAFDGERLCNDFKETLRSNGLLDKDGAKSITKSFEIIQLFSLSIMHRTRISMEDGTALQVLVSPFENTLNATIGIDVSDRTSQKIKR